MSGHHGYAASLRWSGSTGVGYDAYSRRHEVRVGDKARLDLTADSPFLGDGTVPNPEELLLAAATSCQLLSFLAVAARARIDVLAYADDARAVMPADADPMWVQQIELHPVVTLADPSKIGRIERLTRVAHHECFIAASLKSRMTIHARVMCDGAVLEEFTVAD